MNRTSRLALQAAAWAGFAGLVAAFAQGPAFSPVPPGHGELKLSMAHLTERLKPCRPLTEAERMELSATRRVTEICPRGRAPAVVRIYLDGSVLLDETISPTGFHDDGRAYHQQFWSLPAGEYDLQFELRDSPSREGIDMTGRFSLRLRPGDSALLEIGDGTVRLRQAGRPAQTLRKERSP